MARKSELIERRFARRRSLLSLRSAPMSPTAAKSALRKRKRGMVLLACHLLAIAGDYRCAMFLTTGKRRVGGHLLQRYSRLLYLQGQVPAITAPLDAWQLIH